MFSFVNTRPCGGRNNSSNPYREQNGCADINGAVQPLNPESSNDPQRAAVGRTAKLQFRRSNHAPTTRCLGRCCCPKFGPCFSQIASGSGSGFWIKDPAPYTISQPSTRTHHRTPFPFGSRRLPVSLRCALSNTRLATPHDVMASHSQTLPEQLQHTSRCLGCPAMCFSLAP